MTRTEILRTYHEEVSGAVVGIKGIVFRGEAMGKIWKKYLTQLSAMVKGGTLSKEDYHWITDRMIVLNDEIRRA